MICPSSFWKLENMDIAYLYNNLYKTLHMVEDTKQTMHFIMLHFFELGSPDPPDV